MLLSNAYIDKVGSEGYFEERVDKMISEAEYELRQLTVRLYSRWHFTWALRNAVPAADQMLNTEDLPMDPVV